MAKRWLCFAILGCLSVGCSSATPTSPDLSEADRKEMIRRDAEQVMKERREAMESRKR